MFNVSYFQVNILQNYDMLWRIMLGSDGGNIWRENRVAVDGA